MVLYTGHIIKNTGNTEMLIQETEASCNFDDSEVNSKEGKHFFLLGISLSPLFLVIVHFFWHLLDLGILGSSKWYDVIPSLGCRTESKKFISIILPANNATLACFAS